MKQTVSVVVPAYNEKERIVKTLLALKKLENVDKIYVVDDGSKDGTYEQVSKIEGIYIIKHLKNEGKGKALKTGTTEALKDCDILVFADADLEESVVEIEKLIHPILEDKADVTIAKFPPARKKGGFGLVKKLAKYGVYFNTGVRLNAVLSGQRAFKRKVIEDIGMNYEGYGIELGMTIDILKKGYHILEVEVNMYHNETGRNLQGFLHRGKQFMHILLVLLKNFF